MWNETIPDVLRGRLAAIEMVSYMSGPLLGHVEAGAVAAAFGVQASVVSGGVLCVLGVFACGALLPRFVAYDARVFHEAASRPVAGLPEAVLSDLSESGGVGRAKGGPRLSDISGD
jgi:hypothetical protein